MKKAIIIGGSNGIGLAIVNDLQKRGYHVLILDVCAPNEELLFALDKYTYVFCDLLNFNEDDFKVYVGDQDIMKNSSRRKGCTGHW